MALRIDDVDLLRDRMLVERFQEGDETAFETLYTRYFARLQRFCLKRVGDPHEAEEIAQEAFTRAYRALPTFAGERRFYPWMTVIAGRLCVDHHRRQSRSEPSAVIDLGVVDGGQEAILEQADFALLSTALDRLAPRHREVLDMREHRGWSYQQIAEHYEVPVGTVEALLFRARKALKREFIAVAGSERMGGFMALPFLGGIARRWVSAKAKVATWASTLPPIAAPALGVAVAVGSVAAVGTTVWPEGSLATRPPAVVRMMASGVPAAAITDVVDTPAVPESPVTETAAAPRAAAPVAAPTPALPERRTVVETAVAVQPIDRYNEADGARDAGGDHDVVADVAGLYASGDSETVAGETHEAAVQYVKDLNDDLGDLNTKGSK